MKKENKETEEEIRKKIREEINDKWKITLEGKMTEKIDLALNKAYKEFENNLNSFTNNMSKNINKALKLKINQKPLNLVPIDNSNYLVNPILICLSNIDCLVNFCIGEEKDIILENLKENSFFLSFITFINNLWFKKSGNYNPSQIHNLLKELMKEDFNNSDPGVFISFILTKLNEEINYNKKVIKNKNEINLTNKEEVENFFKEYKENIKTKISNDFYIVTETTKKCQKFKKKGGQEINHYYFDYQPIINLYINEPDKVTGIGNNQFANLTLEENFNYLLVDEFNVEDECSVCEENHELRVNKIIKSLNNILIININRDKDPFRIMKLKYPEILNYQTVVTRESENEIVKNDKYELISVIKRASRNELDYIEIDEYNINIYCKNFNDKKWYLYNEEKETEILNQNNEKQIFDEKNALVLVYRKISN